MTLQELIDSTDAVIGKFEKSNRRKWTVEAMLAELTAEIGSLADTIMITEGYRTRRPNQKIDLEDDIADIFFILFYIVRHYEIDFEQAYRHMLDETENKLDQIEKGEGHG